jgi:hypothetical protein
MHVETEHIYPHCPTTIRTVAVGGLTKAALIQELRRNSISMNDYAEKLFSSDRFTTSETRYDLTTVKLTVRQFGFRAGATTAEIYDRAGQLGLGLCPLELGPHLRLQYRDQPEGYWRKPRKSRAPFGSITVASQKVSDNADLPNGFYLRRIKGVLWLRGYCCGPEHIWDVDDHLVFVRQNRPASDG